MSVQWIRRCRPWGHALTDVRIEDGRIVDLRPHDPPAVLADGPEVLDGRGRLLLPSLTDTHCHLDSNRVGLPFRAHTGGPGVWQMMMNDRVNWRGAEVPIIERTTSLLGRMVAHGAGSVRSFAQVDVDCGLERLEAVLAAREAHQDRVRVQVVAFPQAGLLREDGSAKVLEQALREGADVVGGIDPCQLDRDPARHLDIVFGLAERHGVPVDIHLHEPGELARFSASLIVERTEALGMQGKVLISHGYGLFGQDAGLPGILDDLARADIALSTVAPGSAPPLPLARLVEHGIRVGLGQDGQRDYWSPYGNGDMLDRTWQLAFTQGYRPDQLVEHAVAVATIGGRSITSGTPRLRSIEDRPGVSKGDPADLLLVGEEAVTAAVMDRPADRTVLYGGRVVADGLDLIG
ncbi:amidohydrolase family protein [Amycolatopsis palatopharyngis]|uniref:amidohydrolase family protein n=1 Tax=Amycolatopsis palatopharyngis TaxID=187982 RepID=UPI000E225C72|nr:amidohydrolase family protein [Amycolatopsis palatopharyngis]